MVSAVATLEQAVLALAEQRPLLRARDLAAHGLPTMALTGRGSPSCPQGVVCLLSALRVHGIGTQAPFEVWIAIPHNSPTPRLVQPALRAIRMSGLALSEGIEKMQIDGVSVPVFNAAKTVVDCFKYRNKIGLDVALEALRDGWAQRKVTVDALWHYASIKLVANVMRPYLQSVTA